MYKVEYFNIVVLQGIHIAGCAASDYNSGTSSFVVYKTNVLLAAVVVDVIFMTPRETDTEITASRVRPK